MKNKTKRALQTFVAKEEKMIEKLKTKFKRCCLLVYSQRRFAGEAIKPYILIIGIFSTLLLCYKVNAHSSATLHAICFLQSFALMELKQWRMSTFSNQMSCLCEMSNSHKNCKTRYASAVNGFNIANLYSLLKAINCIFITRSL